MCAHMKTYNFTQGALTRVCMHRNTGTHSSTHMQAHASSHAHTLPCVRTDIHTHTYTPAPWEQNKAGGLRVGNEEGGAKAARSLGGRRRCPRPRSAEPTRLPGGGAAWLRAGPRAPGWEGVLMHPQPRGVP